MPDLLPTDQNGSLAAVAAPPNPLQAVMDQIAKSGNTPPPGPVEAAGPPPETGTPNPPPGLLAQAGGGQNGLAPEDPNSPTAQLATRIEKRRAEREALQAKIKNLMGPEGLQQYLPNGGKAKPSDLLRDALYNFSQLNLRNPIYGSLQGHPYTPIQQQRMEQAMKQHGLDLQNMTTYDKTLQEEQVADQFQQNQQRLQQMQDQKNSVAQQSNQIKLQNNLSLNKHRETMDKYNQALALSKGGLMDSEKALTELKTSDPELFQSGDTAFEQMWIADHKDEDPQAFMKGYVKMRNDLHPKNEPIPKSISMLVPDGQGNYTAVNAAPGQTIPGGAITPAGLNSIDTPSNQTKVMAERADTVKYLGGRILSLIDQGEKTLGPLSGRWSDFISGKIGIAGTDWTRLSQDLDLIQTALMQMHTGSRASQVVLEKFKRHLDASRQDPANIRAALDEAIAYANHLTEKSPGPQPTSKPPSKQPPPKPERQVQYSPSAKLYRYSDDGGKTWQTTSNRPPQQ